MTHDSPLHVVLGAGQVGVEIAEKLVNRGARVRLVRRSEGLGYWCALRLKWPGVRDDFRNWLQTAA